MEQQSLITTSVVLMPNCKVCFNFMRGGVRLRKSPWLVPHVVRHRENSEIISWRCSWGNTCEADCLYAMARPGMSQVALADVRA